MISENFDNKTILNELRMFVDLNEQDLQSCLSQVTEVDDNTYEIKVLTRTFRFNNDNCSMEEIT